jgi:eukaryotic-like serine/threonine-protein kinase
LALGTGVGMLVAKRYKLGPSVGRGGMGEVFRATDAHLGRPVAVKLLLPSDRDARVAERFHREARAAARLNDPHVVSVYDFGHHGDGFFLVMELVEGRTVAEELAQHGPLPKDRAIDIIEQAAAGLAAAHREDVVHRDVKPGNLLLAADGTVKVADFGIAHLPGEETTTLTAAGQIIGSTHYLAPERAKGAQAGKAADVYSLGCVLYQLVTGEPPFKAEHPAAILYQHVDAAPARPGLIRPELSGPFEAVLLQMLAKDAAARPSAAEIAAGALRAQPLGADLGRVAAVPAAEALNTERNARPIVAPRNRRRGKPLLAGLIAVLATAAAVSAGVLLNGNETRLPPTTDVGPGPGAGSSTPVSKPTATTSASTTGPTQPRTNPTRSARPSQGASRQVTPRTSSPATASTGTTSPSTSTPSSTTPSVPTQGTPSTGAAPSSTPPTDAPTTNTPATGTPSPAVQGNPTTPASD